MTGTDRTMRKLLPIAATLAALALPGAALAQSATDTRQFPVIGTVPPICSAGTLVGGNSTFDLGVLIDTTTGFLRNDLSAPNKVLSAAFCNASSTISVVATPLAATNFTATPPAGFSRAVNYTATASGWTTTAASFATGAGANPAATQSRPAPFTGDITVGISGFSTVGGNALRPVADTSYTGLVTVTLSVAN